MQITIRRCRREGMARAFDKHEPAEAIRGPSGKVLLQLLETMIVVAVIMMMITVGLEVTAADFARALARRRVIAIVLCSQLIIVPLVASSLISIMNLPPILASGILLVAVAPIGTMSNFYALVSGANVAMALTLMAVSTLLAFVTVPVVSWLAFNMLFSQSIGIEVPFKQVLKQSALGALAPLLIGITIRRLAPAWVARHISSFRKLGVVVAAALVAVVLVDQFEKFTASSVLHTVALALSFTLALLGIGWLAGRLAIIDPEIRRGILFGFPARSVGFATLLAIQVLGNLDFASFAAMFYITQLALMLPFAAFLRTHKRI